MSVDLLSIADTDGYFRRVNRAFERTLGWTRDELLRRPFLDFVHPDDLEATLTELRQLAAGTPSRAFENRYRCVDGTYRRLLWTAVPESGSNLLYAVAHDVTEKSRREARTRQLANAVEQTADTVIITNRAGVIEYVNPAFEYTTGYTAEEALGQTPRLLKSGQHPPEFYRDVWTRLLAGEVVRGVLINRKKGGEQYCAEQTITPMRDARGTITSFVSVVKDITELRRREEQDIELRLAASIQQRLYPAAPPIVSGLDFAAATAPAGAMNGDYFDFFTLRDGALAIAIGDVSGHGLGQALIMAQTRAYLRSMARVHADVGVILTELDKLLAPDLEPGRFISLLLVRLDPKTLVLQYANAGHEPGCLLDPAGAIKMVLESTGPPLGLPGEANPSRVVAASSPVPLERGDVLVLLTDGIAEAESPSGVPFGWEHALGVIGAHGQATAEGIVQALSSAIRSFQDGTAQRDDVTMVVCKREMTTPAGGSSRSA
jgi:sigma-B regulation protein RsbU (phosphoserine phosphatase)